MKSGKVWGATRLVFSSPQFEVHLLDVYPNSRCSKHRHDHKRNAFYVISGDLTIEVWKKDYPLTDHTLLRTNEQTEVGVGEFHRFSSDQGALALEIYYPEPLGQDIFREDHGSTGLIAAATAALVSAVGGRDRGDRRVGTKRGAGAAAPRRRKGPLRRGQ